jgi:hypothetical protein
VVNRKSTGSLLRTDAPVLLLQRLTSSSSYSTAWDRVHLNCAAFYPEDVADYVANEHLVSAPSIGHEICARDSSMENRYGSEHNIYCVGGIDHQRTTTCRPLQHGGEVARIRASLNASIVGSNRIDQREPVTIVVPFPYAKRKLGRPNAKPDTFVVEAS